MRFLPLYPTLPYPSSLAGSWLARACFVPVLVVHFTIHMHPAFALALLAEEARGLPMLPAYAFLAAGASLRLGLHLHLDRLFLLGTRYQRDTFVLLLLWSCHSTHSSLGSFFPRFLSASLSDTPVGLPPSLQGVCG